VRGVVCGLEWDSRLRRVECVGGKMDIEDEEEEEVRKV
jgi:hypothetical protein